MSVGCTNFKSAVNDVDLGVLSRCPRVWMFFHKHHMLKLLESPIEKWTKYGANVWIISLSCLKRFGDFSFHPVLGLVEFGGHIIEINLVG